MKHSLEEIIEMCDQHAVTLGKARNAYLAKEASRKSVESRLVKAAEGKSHAEKLTNAQATVEWEEFHVQLNRLLSEYEFQRDKNEVLNKEFLAQYSEHKDHARLIKKHGSVA